MSRVMSVNLAPCARFAGVILLCASLAACGRDPEPQDDNNQATPSFPDQRDEVDEHDMFDMPAASVDLGEADMPVDGVDMPITEPDVDMSEDMGGDPDSDSDGDGVLDAQDNCPDVENPEQLDRDRDGFGDECDYFPFYADGSNPNMLDTVVEDEGSGLNDDAVLSERLGFELPFSGSGSIGPAQGGQGDIDFYSFTVDEPTVLLVDVSHFSFGESDFIPAVIVLGYDVRNANVFRVGNAPTSGTGFLREIFLPVPGRYTMALSHLGNFVAGSGGGGSPSWLYTVRVSKSTIPSPQDVLGLASPVPHDSSGFLNVFEVDTRDIGAVRVQGNPLNLGDPSAALFHVPVVSLYDPVAGETLAYTTADQLGENNEYVLDALVKNGRDKLWLIEDYVQRNEGEMSTTVIGVDQITLLTETETREAPQDARTDRLLWIDDGASLQGAIDTPRGVAYDIPDEDIYLFTMSRGEVARVTVTPTPGGKLEPAVQLGHSYAQQGNSNFFEVFSADVAGGEESTPMSFLVSSNEDGEMAVRISHADQPLGAPVGGGAYGYTLDFERVQPTFIDLDPTTGSAEAPIPEGGSATVKIDVEAGDSLSFNIDNPGLFLSARLLGPDFRFIERTFSDTLTLRAMIPGTYYLDLLDYNGRGSMTPAVVSVEQIATADFGPLPGTVMDSVEVDGSGDYYRVEVPAGEVFEARVATSDFSPNIQLYDALTFERLTSTGSGAVQMFDEDRELIVYVSAFNASVEPGNSYLLGLRTVNPASMGAPPLKVSGVVDTPPFGQWYRSSVEAGEFYSVGIDAPSADFQPRAQIFDARTLSYLTGTSNRRARFVAEETTDVLIQLYDSSNRGAVDYTYDLRMNSISLEPLLPENIEFAALDGGDSERAYTLSMPGPGLLDASIRADGFEPDLQILTLPFLNDLGAEQVLESTRFATSDADEFIVLIGAKDKSRSGSLEFELEIGHAPAASSAEELEPNDTIMAPQAVTAPAAIRGSLGPADAQDTFAVELEPGQRIWAMSMADMGTGLYALDLQVELYDPDGLRISDDRYSGEGFFPAIYGRQVEKPGVYHVALKLPNGVMSPGNYQLFIVTSPVERVTQIEPNDDLMSATDLGELRWAARVSTGFDMTDVVDVYSFTMPEPGQISARLIGAQDGQELRLLDSAGAELAASGLPHDAQNQPFVISMQLSAGVYYIEHAIGAGAAESELLIEREGR